MRNMSKEKIDEFEQIIGMKVEDAMKFAKDKNVAVRISKEDNKLLGLTMDYISDRINLEVKKGKVVKYHRG